MNSLSLEAILVWIESSARRTLISHKNSFLIQILYFIKTDQALILIITTMKSNRISLYSRENGVTIENKVKLENWNELEKSSEE